MAFINEVLAPFNVDKCLPSLFPHPSDSGDSYTCALSSVWGVSSEIVCFKKKQSFGVLELYRPEEKHLFSSSAAEPLGNGHFVKHLLLGLAGTDLESSSQYYVTPHTQARLYLCVFALGHFSREVAARGSLSSASPTPTAL